VRGRISKNVAKSIELQAGVSACARVYALGFAIRAATLWRLAEKIDALSRASARKHRRRPAAGYPQPASED